MASKAVVFVLICAVLAGLLLFGCTASSAQDIAKKNPVLKKFLSDHPNAKFAFIDYAASDFILKESFWEDHCKKILPKQDYYLALADDKDAKLAVLFERGQLQAVCAAQINKSGFAPTNNNLPSQPPVVPAQNPPEDKNKPSGNSAPPPDENVPALPAVEPPVQEPPVVEQSCEEYWACTDWGDCNGGTQERQCFELEHCPGDNNAPETQQSC